MMVKWQVGNAESWAGGSEAGIVRREKWVEAARLPDYSLPMPASHFLLLPFLGMAQIVVAPW